MNRRLSPIARERLLRPLWQLREGAKRLGHRWQRGYVPLSEMQALSPVFIIGGNRSGTSIVSSILAQNTGLEGLFGRGTASEYNAAGHSLGFCESMHLWFHLFPDDRARGRNAHYPFWALPQYIGDSYRWFARSDRERRRLAWDIERHRRTDRHPLIKDQYNTLRVGLIVDVLPKSRFLLVTRSRQDFVQRGSHKWATDRSGTDLSQPLASYHWHMVNLVARYDLEIYAPGQYTTVWLDALHDGPTEAREQFARVTSALSLPPHEYDFAKIAKHWTPREGTVSSDDASLTDVPRIIESERRVLAELRRQPATE